MTTKPTSKMMHSKTKRAAPRGKTIAAKLVVAPRALDAAATYAPFDGLTGALMVANSELRITYMNRSARELFAQHNEVFARTFPGFDSTKLIGENRV